MLLFVQNARRLINTFTSRISRYIYVTNVFLADTRFYNTSIFKFLNKTNFSKKLSSLDKFDALFSLLTAT